MLNTVVRPSWQNTFELLLCVRFLVEHVQEQGMWETEQHLSGFNAVSVVRSEVLWRYKGPGKGRD